MDLADKGEEVKREMTRMKAELEKSHVIAYVDGELMKMDEIENDIRTSAAKAADEVSNWEEQVLEGYTFTLLQKKLKA